MMFIPSLTLEVKVIINWLMAQWLALHSRSVFRDGFLLAYTMWCWNSCWVGSALSFPVGFSSNSKKEAPIGVPGTSIRSVPTLTGEGINTHTGSTCTQASGKAAASNCISNSKELQVEALVSLNAYKIEEGLFHGYVRSSEVQNYQDLQRGWNASRSKILILI